MNILFDLDGTLTDSGVGIMNCARQTLTHYGLPIPDDAAMRSMVGPPLRSSFLRFGIRPEQLNEAVTYYRSIYNKTGKFENFPYPGIEELLQKLKSAGHRLFVATSKPETMSIEILEHFGLAHYFDAICGSLLDGERDKKADVITYVLETAEDKDNAIMVGDTVFDIQGANECNLPAIAVSWGYGNVADMVAAGAKAVAATTEALYDLLMK